MNSTAEYLYLVLIPVAETFRKSLPLGKRSFAGIRNDKSCRVKFAVKAVEKDWQKFCSDNELKNDTSLEY